MEEQLILYCVLEKCYIILLTHTWLMVNAKSTSLPLCTGMQSTCRSLYGKLLEIWKDAHIPEGPAMFLPIHKLDCRCTLAYSTIPLPDSTEERVIFSSPLPGLKYN